MERWDAPVSEEQALKGIEALLLESMKKLENACGMHIPFGLSDERNPHIKYIPERCIVTFFSWGLIENGFAVFNEQTVDCNATAQKTQRFDLLARRFAPEGACVQIKAEAKGNLDGGYKEILADIKRMEKYPVANPKIKMSNPEANWHDSRFPYRFNIVLTQNWGLRELSDWWVSQENDRPKRKGSELRRKAEAWEVLKGKLCEAKKRGKMPLLKSDPCYNYTVDVLYAIFADTSVEYKEEVRRKEKQGGINGSR